MEKDFVLFVKGKKWHTENSFSSIEFNVQNVSIFQVFPTLPQCEMH